MRRIVITFLTLLLLWHIVAEVNHALAALHIYLFVGGLFVAYAALRQPLGPGLTASLLVGLVCDARASLEDFGLHFLLFATAHVVVFHLRDRIPRDDTTGRVIVALFTNLALFLLLSFIQITHSPAPAAVWPRLISDLVWSQIFLALAAPWFFALQARALILARVDRESLA